MILTLISFEDFRLLQRIHNNKFPGPFPQIGQRTGEFGRSVKGKDTRPGAGSCPSLSTCAISSLYRGCTPGYNAIDNHSQLMGGRILMEKRMEKLLEGHLPPDGGAKISVLPTSKSFSAERCLNKVLAKWPFSSHVLLQAVRALSGEVWVRVQSYVKVGSSYRPVVIFDGIEQCQQMSPRDLLRMMCALVDEIESELESLRQEGVEIATCADLERAWSNPV
jgi:hypothetical protein